MKVITNMIMATRYLLPSDVTHGSGLDRVGIALTVNNRSNKFVAIELHRGHVACLR